MCIRDSGTVEVRVRRPREGAIAVEVERTVRCRSAAAQQGPRQLSVRVVRIAVVTTDRSVHRDIFSGIESVIVRDSCRER